MKCCGTRYQNAQTLCETCGELVLFSEYSIDQSRWTQAIDTVSCGGLYHFTETQLFSEFLDEKSDSTDIYRLTLVFFVFGQVMFPTMGLVIVLTLATGLFFLSPKQHVSGVLVMLFSMLGMGLWFSIGLSGLLLIPALICSTLCLRHEPTLLLSFDDIQKIQRHWFSTYPNNRFIERAELGLRMFVPDEARGVLVVDQDILVDFFVLNGFVERYAYAILSISHLPLIARASKKNIFFLHGSGEHVASVQAAFSFVDIGWKEEDLLHHPSFTEFTDKNQLPVDLLSPKELLESTEYAVQNHTSVLTFFEKNV